MKKRLNVLALLCDPTSKSIYSRVKQLDSEKTLADMRHIIDCDLVTIMTCGVMMRLCSNSILCRICTSAMA